MRLEVTLTGGITEGDISLQLNRLQFTFLTIWMPLNVANSRFIQHNKEAPQELSVNINSLAATCVLMVNKDEIESEERLD